jgi:hypothetical protein
VNLPWQHEPDLTNPNCPLLPGNEVAKLKLLAQSICASYFSVTPPPTGHCFFGCWSWSGAEKQADDFQRSAQILYISIYSYVDIKFACPLKVETGFHAGQKVTFPERLIDKMTGIFMTSQAKIRRTGNFSSWKQANPLGLEHPKHGTLTKVR